MVMPFALGVAGVQVRSFILFDACSGLIWSGTFAAAGYCFGATLTSVLGGSLERIIAASVVAVFVVVVLFRITNARIGYRNKEEPPVEHTR
jgi:membrane protein DedA with SNARE-associated domain